MEDILKTIETNPEISQLLQVTYMNFKETIINISSKVKYSHNEPKRRGRREGGGHKFSSDPALLWLWGRPTATAPIPPLVWEPPYAMGVALKSKKQKKEKQKWKNQAS